MLRFIIFLWSMSHEAFCAQPESRMPSQPQAVKPFARRQWRLQTNKMTLNC
jgi:hypothetical protein